jgi:hypothetical protein
LGTPSEHPPHAQFRKLKLDHRGISDAYRCALHKQFEHHNVYRRLKEISPRGESAEWNIVEEAKYEGVERDIGRAMEHAQNACSTRKLHTTDWSKSNGRATLAIRYWDVQIKRKGVRDLNDAVLNYCVARSNVDVKAFDKTMPLPDCHHQVKNARAKLKDVVADAKNYELEIAIVRVHKRHPELFDDPALEEELEDQIVNELKARGNR